MRIVPAVWASPNMGETPMPPTTAGKRDTGVSPV
jgi:hypothetical protein